MRELESDPVLALTICRSATSLSFTVRHSKPTHILSVPLELATSRSQVLSKRARYMHKVSVSLEDRTEIVPTLLHPSNYAPLYECCLCYESPDQRYDRGRE